MTQIEQLALRFTGAFADLAVGFGVVCAWRLRRLRHVATDRTHARWARLEAWSCRLMLLTGGAAGLLHLLGTALDGLDPSGGSVSRGLLARCVLCFLAAGGLASALAGTAAARARKRAGPSPLAAPRLPVRAALLAAGCVGFLLLDLAVAVAAGAL
ncbi:MAG TPA: hypothetical protein VM695_10335 [Phycisphaerae bacterium]|nr:hypothetical protein [Phycisphaerae bacterium]